MEQALERRLSTANKKLSSLATKLFDLQKISEFHRKQSWKRVKHPIISKKRLCQYYFVSVGIILLCIELIIE